MFTLDASVHSSGNLFLPYTSLWENVYFIMSNMERHFTEAILCRLVVIFLILKNKICQLTTLQCKHGSVCYPIVLSAHDWHKGERTGVLSICSKS